MLRSFFIAYLSKMGRKRINFFYWSTKMKQNIPIRNVKTKVL